MSTAVRHAANLGGSEQVHAPKLLIPVLASCVAIAVLISQDALAAALCVGFLFLAIFRTEAALLGGILLLPLAPPLDTKLLFFRDVSTIIRYMMFAGVWLRCAFRGERIREKFLSSKFNRLAGLYLLVVLISANIANTASLPAKKSIFRLFSYVSLYLAVAAWMRSEHQVRKILKALLAAGIGASLFGFYQAVIQDYGGLYYILYPNQEEYLAPWSGRITSFLNNSNPLAAYLNLVLPFAISLSFTAGKTSLRLLGRLCLVLGSLALALTQSRGGLIAYAATLFLAAWLLARRGQHRRRLIVLLVIGLAIAVPVLSAALERLGGLDEFTAFSRLVMYSTAAGMFLSSPILGVGYGNFPAAYDALTSGISTKMLGDELVFSRPGAHAHNLYLQLLAETGVVGFVLFLFILLAVLRLSLRQLLQPHTEIDRHVGFGVFAGVLTILVHGFVDDSFVVPQFSATFWLILSLLMVTERLRVLPESLRFSDRR